ncbi:DUF899 family protein [Nannocystis sp. SCPEA4]|uniref:DUF899 family protein n=1 Tax=Nannocystis sp. SCPEA4 TaxID=2996787 RepID=UPI00226FAE6F|nr:DUF899 family protein [Nannocystis sp. SCPEA4]MCY1054329.1 DUF899 family protein [Nannocystis sp. SCPEA4]
MGLTFPNESAEYRAARERLLAREIELRRLTETVARERRALPPGGVVPEDYVFEGLVNGAPAKVRLSELFLPGQDTLAIYSYMFGPERARPCSMCTPLLDGLDAAEPNIRQRLALVVVAESPLAKLRAFTEERGWRRLRLLSTAGNRYNRDYHGKGSEGGDTTMLNVFRREGATVRHFWGTEMAHTDGDPGQDHRGLDMLSPIFAMFDLTPAGRGDFYTRLSYP